MLINENPQNTIEYPFEVIKRKLYIYQQYRHLEWIKEFFEFIDNYIQEWYYNNVSNFWNARDILRSRTKSYLTFYAINYLGINRPLVNPPIMLAGYDDKNYYDEKSKTPFSYDTEATEAGLLPDDLFFKYLRFIYNYNQPVWTHDYIMFFLADWCGCECSLIRVSFNYLKKITYHMPDLDHSNEVVQTKALAFINLDSNYRDEMCLPFGNEIRFVIGYDTANNKPEEFNNDYMSGWDSDSRYPPEIPADELLKPNNP